MINWLKNILSKRKSDLPAKPEEQEIVNLVLFFEKKIAPPTIGSNLETKIKIFKESNLKRKIISLPEVYLLLEEYYLDHNKQATKEKLRKKIEEKFPLLQQHKGFRLIFYPLEKQELILCKDFLLEVLKKSSELTGSSSDSKIRSIKTALALEYDFASIDIIKEQKRLLEFSNEIFFRIKKSLGINAITNIYLFIYKKHFESYHLLDSFTAILNVIPGEILAKDLINFPTKQQMLKMLQKQLYSLEKINERLTQEIIDKKKIEEDLKYSEYLKSIILETAMDGVILTNSKGTVLNWNKQAEHILELKREETIGKSVYHLVPYKLRKQLKASFANYIKTGDDDLINKRVETSVNRRNGTVVYIELTIVAIEIKDDYLFNAFFRDITNRKIIDNEIREAKVLAEKSAKAKSVFLSNMSHEIRTPLNVILGLTGILQKSNFSNPTVDKKNLDGIQFSAENLLVLINDILDFSKIEAGKLTLHKEDFNLHELLNNLSRGFKIKADEKGLTYKVFIDTTVPKFIVGDQLRLNQILINLLGNAIKFTQKGEVIIQVTTHEILDDHITLNFLVKDTGVGIPEDKLKNIFESFYQVHKPGKNKIEGTGLGLSISKQLIELQGGILNAKSTPQVGSSFDFSIQFDQSNFKTSDHHNANSEIIDNLGELSGMKVLVVEDNKMNQFFIKQLLSNWSVEVVIAENGKIAIETLEKETFDLILMDMHMPVMDGSEATQIIRKSTNPKINQIPIVACSADVFPESKMKAMSSGMNFYLTKPLSEKALEEILYSLKPNVEHLKEEKNESTKTIGNSSAQSKTQYCDLSFLKKTFDHDNETIKSVLQIFLEETPNDYKALTEVIKNKDSSKAKEIAHKLKSSFKTIGLEKEATILEKIEKLSANDDDFGKIHEEFELLRLSFPLILKEIEDTMRDLSSSNS